MLDPVTRTMLFASLGVCLAIGVFFYWRRGAGHRIWIAVLLASGGVVLALPYVLDRTGSAAATLLLCVGVGLLVMLLGFALIVRVEALRGQEDEEEPESSARRMMRFPAYSARALPEAEGGQASERASIPRARDDEEYEYAEDYEYVEEPEYAGEPDYIGMDEREERPAARFLAEYDMKRRMAAEDVPAEDPHIMEEAVVEEIPVDEAVAEETPAEETPVEEASVEETPAEETPAEETPAEETPVEETAVEETPVEEPIVVEEAAPPEEATPPEPPKPAKSRSGDRALLDEGFALSLEYRWSEAADAFAAFRETAQDPWLRKQADFERLNALIEAERAIEAIDLTFEILESDYDLSAFEREQIAAILEILQQ